MNFLRKAILHLTSQAINEDEARDTGEAIGINWDEVEFEPADLAKGIEVELEHGTKDEETNVTDDDLESTAKIAWAHLKESADYYDLLSDMEKQF